jgi:hypothetical protein
MNDSPIPPRAGLSRRLFLGSSALLGAAGPNLAAAPPWPLFDTRDRLDQGPFEIEQDDGWMTLAAANPTARALRNPGLGLVGYTWEESGPSLAARKGTETLEQHVDRLSGLPFVDVLYIRCDWKHVQSRPGRLDLSPVWKLTFDAAKARGLRVAFRVQLSNPNSPDGPIAMPDFVREKTPLVSIGTDRFNGGDKELFEPRYDHVEFQKAFRELNELLAAEFDGNPLVDWVDLMQYGFWGEGHTSNLHNPFPDFATAERTFVEMTDLQLGAWKRTPLAVNTEPDISRVGNRRVIEMAMSAGAWLRSDSVLVEEPIQIDMISNRPPWLAAVMEDGYDRQYELSMREHLQQTILHALDLGANYWSLWTESADLGRFFAEVPQLLRALQARLGYRVRPAWVWQRKRREANELVMAIANDGVAGVPGVLRIEVSTPDGRFRATGSLDPGQPQAGRLRQCAFTVPRELEGQSLRIEASIEIRPGVRRPVAWAIDGAAPYEVKLQRWDDPTWRKNV